MPGRFAFLAAVFVLTVATPGCFDYSPSTWWMHSWPADDLAMTQAVEVSGEQRSHYPFLDELCSHAPPFRGSEVNREAAQALLNELGIVGHAGYATARAVTCNGRTMWIGLLWDEQPGPTTLVSSVPWNATAVPAVNATMSERVAFSALDTLCTHPAPFSVPGIDRWDYKELVQELEVAAGGRGDANYAYVRCGGQVFDVAVVYVITN